MSYLKSYVYMLLFAQSIISFISQPWPWYISGVIIATVMGLLIFAGKSFGVSATLRAGCAAVGAGKWSEFFNFDWKNSQGWNLIFAVGAILGGYIAATYMSSSEPIELGARTIEYVESIGFSAPNAADTSSAILPSQFSDTDFIFSAKGLFFLILGGFFVGFGARYAGGCTSGHAISGLSNLQLPSLIAVIGFFIGGLLMTHLILPFIF